MSLLATDTLAGLPLHTVQFLLFLFFTIAKSIMSHDVPTDMTDLCAKKTKKKKKKRDVYVYV
jgi:hypothetical protein